MRYYEREHFDAYARIRREGLEQWNDLHPGDSGHGYHRFPTREFLTRHLPVVSGRRPSLLEYGCGTGAAACFLTTRGYRVHAVDLVPDAIDLARRHANEQGLAIRFEVGDVCRWGDPTEQYDYVVDSLCLQSIVTDEDRSRVLSGVRKRLPRHGRYLISTAVFSPDRTYHDDDHFDPETGIVRSRLAGRADGATMTNGSWYLPNRRHLTAAALRAELERHGFEILEQSPSGGDLVCRPT